MICANRGRIPTVVADTTAVTTVRSGCLAAAIASICYRRLAAAVTRVCGGCLAAAITRVISGCAIAIATARRMRLTAAITRIPMMAMMMLANMAGIAFLTTTTVVIQGVKVFFYTTA